MTLPPQLARTHTRHSCLAYRQDDRMDVQHTTPSPHPRAHKPCSCLAYRQDARMDVHAAAAHPYMAPPKRAGRGGAAAGGRENLAGVAQGLA